MVAGRFPTNIEVYLEFPLYEAIDLATLSENAKDYIEKIRYPNHTIDCYCPICDERSTFKPNLSLNGRLGTEFLFRDGLFTVEFQCSRNNAHKIYFTLIIQGNLLTKIGQFPSMASLEENNIGQYRKILSKEKFKEFSRAIGLASHGIGIGSFVYLRRIFEGLIEESHNNALNTSGWDEELFQKSHVDEKIRLLKEFLPVFLVENSGLYGILSKGIHVLSEDECLKHFSIVKVGIELILDEKLEQKKKEDKIRQAKQAIIDVKQKLSK